MSACAARTSARQGPEQALQYSPISPNALNFGKRSSCFIKMNFYFSIPAAAGVLQTFPKCDLS